MLTRNRARLLNIEISSISNVEIDINKQKQSKQSKQPRMVSFEENIEYINYRPIYEVNIDFDEAHDAWVANKIKQKNGCYKYRKHIKPPGKTKSL
jgi:hypothetical protein